MSHTPGPWRIDLHGDKDDRFAIEGKAFDSSWRWIADRVRGGNKQETRANANLIAAAPELLEALKFAKEVIDDQIERFHADCRCQLCESLPMQIDAAIAKAESVSK